MMKSLLSETLPRLVFAGKSRNWTVLSASYNSKIDPSKLKITKTSIPKQLGPLDGLLWGKSFSDHMLVVDWDSTNGWHAPEIVPYGNLSISPAAPCLHYGVECFEGMKAYKDISGKTRLFRPDMNMKRLNFSMTRMCLPSLDDGFLECLKILLRIEDSWIPQKHGYSLYLRPTCIGTTDAIGVQPTDHAKLYVIASPVGPYFKSGFKPVKLLADTDNVRAWPGGAGNAKVGGNYGPCMLPARVALQKHGCSQILWLFGEEHQVTEVGAMNIFFLLKNEADDGVELVTPSLERGDILHGITRDSILALCKEWSSSISTSPLALSAKGPLTVSERHITMRELKAAAQKGQFLEAFAAGTGAVLVPVKSILYQGEDVNVSSGEDIGPVSLVIWNTLLNIQYGRVPHPWSVKV